VRRPSLLISLVVVAVLLTGCLTPKANVKIEPNPIVLTAEKLLDNDFVIKDIKLNLRTSGFSTGYIIECARVAVLAEDDKSVFKKMIDTGKKTPIIPCVSHTE